MPKLSAPKFRIVKFMGFTVYADTRTYIHWVRSTSAKTKGLD